MYNQPRHVTPQNLIFGIFNLRPPYLVEELVKVNRYGNAYFRKGSGSKISWAGNLTSSLAVFVIHNVQCVDIRVYGIEVDSSNHQLLSDSVQLQVSANRKYATSFV